MHTNRVFEAVKCVLFIEVSSFQGVLIREVPLYVYMHGLYGVFVISCHCMFVSALLTFSS